MAAVATSTWSRRFVLAGAAFLVAWQLAAVAGLGRRVGVLLGLYGFVLHTVFGKAYSLIPTYFDRELATTRWLPLHFGATVVGTAVMAAAWLPGVPRSVGVAGVALWAAGVAAFVATIGWSIRGNPLGAETATGDANAARRPVDRAANLAMPVALAYLVAGTYATAAGYTALPGLRAGFPAATHLLAAGTAAILVFAVGLRLLPRFLVSHPPRWAVPVVLVTGALAPVVLATSLWEGLLFRAGAVLEATAVIGHAVAVAAMLSRTDRRRVGFLGVGLGAAAGVLGVAIGLHFAFGGRPGGLVAAHYRLNLLGFLGLTILGVAYQFYPPGVGDYPLAGDRSAAASILAIAAGLGLEALAVPLASHPLLEAGRGLALAGAVLYAYLLAGLFRQRYG